LGWLGVFFLLLTSLASRLGWSEASLLSLLSSILPYLYFGGAGLMGINLLFKSIRRPSLWILIALSISGFSLWSPLWLIRLPSTLDSPNVSVASWNVARMGELAQRDRSAQRQESLKCVSVILQAAGAQVFALQEISKARVQALQDELHISCRHIDYHGIGGRRRGGLAICVQQGGPWKLNFAQNLKLPGQWRALFAEIEYVESLDLVKQIKARQLTQQPTDESDSMADTSSSPTPPAPPVPPRVNIINVHFLPHRIAPKDIKEAVGELAQGSPRAFGGLLRQILKTTSKQGDQAEALMEVINTFKDPTLIMGDFNAPPHSSVHWALGEQWVDVWESAGYTFGATRFFGGWLPFRVDFIYALAGAFEIGGASVIPAECSDHRPITAQVRVLR
jgi:endonuclease/exonuclease/phosphatase family metal-dependent hydrolase